jgi:hypothetical protein
MANSTTIQTLVDGPRNTILKLDGLLDTSDQGSTIIVDPATLSDYNINGVKATKLRINKINFDVEDGLDVELFWDASSPVRIGNFVGRGKVDAWRYGGIVNNAASPTGKITLQTQGWSTGAILSYTIVLELVKQGPG